MGGVKRDVAHCWGDGIVTVIILGLALDEINDDLAIAQPRIFGIKELGLLLFLEMNWSFNTVKAKLGIKLDRFLCIAHPDDDTVSSSDLVLRWLFGVCTNLRGMGLGSGRLLLGLMMIIGNGRIAQRVDNLNGLVVHDDGRTAIRVIGVM